MIRENRILYTFVQWVRSHNLTCDVIWEMEQHRKLNLLDLRAYLVTGNILRQNSIRHLYNIQCPWQRTHMILIILWFSPIGFLLPATMPATRHTTSSPVAPDEQTPLFYVSNSYLSVLFTLPLEWSSKIDREQRCRGRYWCGGIWGRWRDEGVPDPYICATCHGCTDKEEQALQTRFIFVTIQTQHPHHHHPIPNLTHPRPSVNDLGQQICWECGLPGHLKDGNCVEKWGPGPMGSGTMCDWCRKKMKRIEKRAMIDTATSVVPVTSMQLLMGGKGQGQGQVSQYGSLLFTANVSIYLMIPHHLPPPLPPPPLHSHSHSPSHTHANSHPHSHSSHPHPHPYSHSYSADTNTSTTSTSMCPPTSPLLAKVTLHNGVTHEPCQGGNSVRVGNDQNPSS